MLWTYRLLLDQISCWVAPWLNLLSWAQTESPRLGALQETGRGTQNTYARCSSIKWRQCVGKTLKGCSGGIRELKKPRRRRQQKPRKFAYLTIKNSIFARFARAVFIFDILKTFTFFLRREMFNFVLCPKHWFQFNSRIVRTHFLSRMTFNNWKSIAETRSYIFRRLSCFHRRLVCLTSL